jgi:hypothetical protein
LGVRIARLTGSTVARCGPGDPHPLRAKAQTAIEHKASVTEASREEQTLAAEWD